MDDGHTNIYSSTESSSPVCTITLGTLFLQIVSESIKDNVKYPRCTKNDGSQYDFIIVGAGSAGCVVANRLSEISDWSILLVEMGGEEPDVGEVPAFAKFLKEESEIAHIYNTEPREDICDGAGCEWITGTVLGGSSSINGMVYCRGNKENFNHWAEVGNYGWEYDEILQYFKKSEDNKNDVDSYYHGFDGYLSVQHPPYIDKNEEAAFQSLLNLDYKNNSDFNGEYQMGVSYAQYTMNNGRRHSANKAFLQPVLKTRKNLHLMSGATVTKVLVDETGLAYGVEYALNEDKEELQYAYAKKEVILSAGALGSPKILMLSGIGPKDTLEKLNIEIIKDAFVGYNLQDHPLVSVVEATIDKFHSTVPKSLTTYFEDMLEYLANNGPLTSTTNTMLAFINSKFSSSDDVPDIKLSLLTHLNPLEPETTVFTKNSHYCHENKTKNYPSCYYNKMSIRFSVLYPKSRGLLTLRSAYPFDDPIIYDGYWSDFHDFEVAMEGVYAALKLVNEAHLKESGWTLSEIQPEHMPEACTSYEFNTDDYWKCVTWASVKTSYHYVGTCKMGPVNDKTAVVDPELRVYGIDNIRVIDASIMPFIVGCNTNAPTYMIAEKGADMIKQSWIEMNKD